MFPLLRRALLVVPPFALLGTVRTVTQTGVTFISVVNKTRIAVGMLKVASVTLILVFVSAFRSQKLRTTGKIAPPTLCLMVVFLMPTVILVELKSVLKMLRLMVKSRGDAS